VRRKLRRRHRSHRGRSFCRSGPARRATLQLRTLAILRQTLGSLDAVERIVRITVYMQTTPDFTMHSEVADAASDLLHRVFGDAGMHTLTSVGVYSLPKNASVEMDMVVTAAYP